MAGSSLNPFRYIIAGKSERNSRVSMRTIGCVESDETAVFKSGRFAIFSFSSIRSSKAFISRFVVVRN